jgi:protein-S-isoprenylcysteine O-methyltransferase Ste14
MAWSYERLELSEVRLFKTADLDCSKSGNFRIVFGTRLRLLFAIGSGLQCRGEKRDPVADLLTSSAFLGTNFRPLCNDGPLNAYREQVVREPGGRRFKSSLPCERSIYVLFSSLALLLLFWKWQPLGGVVWNVGSTAGQLALSALYALGWLTLLTTTFLINHIDLFGLRQVWLHLRGRAYTSIGFRTPGPYRYVRHPLYVGWLLVFWSGPMMTSAHLVFAVATTAYNSRSDPIRGTRLGSVSRRIRRVSPTCPHDSPYRSFSAARRR